MYDFEDISGKFHHEVLLRSVKYEIFVIPNPITCDNFNHLFGRGKVRINGREREVVGIERFRHEPPWKEGETIGLVCTCLEEH